MSDNTNSDKPPQLLTNGNLKNELLVYVYNVVEDEWLFIDSLADPKKKMVYIEDCEDTTDCFFLSLAVEPECVYISPKKISAEFYDYAKSLLGFKNMEVIVPPLKSHLICDDLLADTRSLNQLLEIAKNYKRLVLISYAATENFYRLKDTLIQLGIEVYTPEAPEIDCAWTVNFFGSKSGIRQLAQKSAALEPDFVMPEGIICVGRFDAAKIAANKYIKQKGVVIKTNKGSGGNGVLIYRENDLPNNYQECEKTIYKRLGKEKYWENYPIVIEDFVNINYSMGGGFPSIEFKIQKNGRIDMLYYCSMMVTDKGKFYGLDINDQILNDRITARIIDTGYFIAEQYSAAGYRGHFDVDLITARNNQVYVSESNTRNSGGTDVFRISQKLAGKTFMKDNYVISRSRLEIPPSVAPTFDNILNKVGNLLYSPQTQEGVIISSENSLKGKEMIYIIIAKSKKRAFEINDEFRLVIQGS